MSGRREHSILTGGGPLPFKRDWVPVILINVTLFNLLSDPCDISSESPNNVQELQNFLQAFQASSVEPVSNGECEPLQVES
jgi:hypothetical protein